MTEERKAQQNLRIILIIVSLAIFLLTLTAGLTPNQSAEEKLNSAAPFSLYEPINSFEPFA